MWRHRGSDGDVGTNRVESKLICYILHAHLVIVMMLMMMLRMRMMMMMMMMMFTSSPSGLV